MPAAASITLVVAAVIRDLRGRVMLTRRPEGLHMGGLWEFPGGKVENGESPADALARELAEELSLRAEVGRPITFAVHEEPGMRIVLLFYGVSLDGQTPEPVEGQEIVWVEPERLHEYPTPPADAELVRLLTERSAG